jgi:hypothetical protein
MLIDGDRPFFRDALLQPTEPTAGCVIGDQPLPSKDELHLVASAVVEFSGSRRLTISGPNREPVW